MNANTIILYILLFILVQQVKFSNERKTVKIPQQEFFFKSPVILPLKGKVPMQKTS